MTDLVILVTNAPPEHAERVARGMLERRLVACVNIIPGVRSLYWWDGTLHDEPEATLVLKTTRERAPEARASLLELHPHDVPELLSFTPQDVPQAYRTWAVEQVSDASSPG